MERFRVEGISEGQLLGLGEAHSEEDAWRMLHNFADHLKTLSRNFAARAFKPDGSLLAEIISGSQE